MAARLRVGPLQLKARRHRGSVVTPLSWVERRGEQGHLRPESRGRRGGGTGLSARTGASKASPHRHEPGLMARLALTPSRSAGLLGPTARAAAAWQALCYQLPQLPGADRRPESTGRRGQGDTVSGRGILEHRSATTAGSPSRWPLQFPPAHVGLQ